MSAQLVAKCRILLEGVPIKGNFMSVKRLLDILFAVFAPSHWIRLGKASKVVDEVVNRAIDENLIVSVEHCFATLKNGTEVWIENYPYSFGNLYLGADCHEYLVAKLPYRRTAYKLNKIISKVKKQQWNVLEKEVIRKLHEN